MYNMFTTFYYYVKDLWNYALVTFWVFLCVLKFRGISLFVLAYSVRKLFTGLALAALIA